MKKRRNSYAGNMIGLATTNIVGAGLLGASAQAANAIPAGMAHDFAGTAVGVGSIGMLGPNIKFATSSLGINSKKSKKKGFSI